MFTGLVGSIPEEERLVLEERGMRVETRAVTRVARSHGYHGDMRNLPRDVAKAIYMQDYVVRPGFAAVMSLSEPLAEELVDTGVNMGPAVPARWL